MTHRVIPGLLIAAFAVAVGHLTWQSLLGPAVVPEYLVGGEGPALAGLDTTDKHLYVRRLLYLSQRPRCAWIQVLGRDQLQVFVNGKFVEGKTLDGFPVAVLADLAPYLRVGPNVIGIHARQSSVGPAPVIAVEGACTLSDGEHPLRADEQWRCGTAFERRASWWMTPDFDENYWPPASITTCALRGRVSAPPRAVTTPNVGMWITPAQVADNSAAVRREFEIVGRTAQAWVRVTATSAYRLAVNGVLLDEREEQVGTRLSNPPVQRIYDITPIVRSGKNVVALVLTGTLELPHVLADVEVQDGGGEVSRFGTDARWCSRAGLSGDWAGPSPADGSAWQPCAVELSDLGYPPWSYRQEVVDVSLPWSLIAGNLAGQLVLSIGIGIVTLVACAWAARQLPATALGTVHSGAFGVVSLTLVPATLAVASAVLASYDPRIARQDLYQAKWVFLAVLSVPLQWALLALLARGSRLDWRAPWLEKGMGPRFGKKTAEWVALGLVLLGFWLRVREINTEPFQWDEVENYNATQSVLQRGFPAVEVHKDMPLLVIHTSELEFVPHALVALVTDNDHYIVRLPGICFSTLTVWLVFVAGRRLFNSLAGLIAAAIYTFGDACIAMSDLGRYFAQLEFLTLLTVYCYWLTIRGKGAINRRALWCTVVSFVAMFLTWEASVLLAPAMVAAALVQRRGRLHMLIGNGSVWLGMLVVLLAILAQRAHATFAQTRFLWYGISLSDVKLMAMWRQETFHPWYYIWESSWSQDAFLPMLCLTAAVVLAVQSRYQRPLRFVAIVHLGTCFLMVFTLPNTQFRYVHHLIPLLILLTSAAIMVVARSLVKAARRRGMPGLWRAYVGAVALLVPVAVVALSSGQTVQLREMDTFLVEGASATLFKYPHLGGAALYVRDHMREGDVMIASDTYQVNHLMGVRGHLNRPTDYIALTRPFFVATIDDDEDALLDRRDGTQAITSQAALEDLFARHGRVWYIVQPGQHYISSGPNFSTFLRQNMDVVYEDWETLVLFKGDNHRPAYLQLRDEATLNKAQANFLP